MCHETALKPKKFFFIRPSARPESHLLSVKETWVWGEGGLPEEEQKEQNRNKYFPTFLSFSFLFVSASLSLSLSVIT